MPDGQTGLILVGWLLGIFTAIGLAWVRLYILAPLQAPFKPQGVSQKTSKTPWQVMMSALMPIAVLLLVFAVLTLFLEPAQREEIWSTVGTLLVALGALVVSIVRMLVSITGQILSALTGGR